MRFTTVLFSIFISGAAALAQTRTTAVYDCKFTIASADGSHLRLKQYPAPNSSSDLGKIDLMIGSDVLESTLTKIYQVPFYEDNMYVQIWYAAEARVDAQFSTTGKNRVVPATYRKGSLQQDIICTNLN